MAETNSMSRRPTGDPRNKYRRSSDYEEQLPYPTSSPFSHKSPARRRFLWFFSRLTLKRTLVLVPCLILFAFLWSGIPPSYDHIRVYEQNLPQHHHSPMPSNSQNFLRFEGMIWGHGLNNVLQETLLMSYLAHAATRSFVFEDYIWSRLPYGFSGLSLRPARIPLNALITGPSAGGPMPDGAPLAVSLDYFEQVCPHQDRVTLNSAALDAPTWWDGDELIRWWTDKFSAHKDVRCLVVDTKERVIFDRHLFGSPRILKAYSAILASPILSSFSWSPLVQSGVARNFALFQPEDPTILTNISSPSIVPGLVAIHIRRGDFTRHCPRIVPWHAHYMGFNQHPDLADRFDPEGYLKAHNVKGDWDNGVLLPYYLEHCLPTPQQVNARLRAVRRDYPSLKRVYVLSNASKGWLETLANLLKSEGWEDLKSTADLQLDDEQRYVGMAVDMAIAEKAEVVVGNGFSSLTANIVLFRMSKGIHIKSNRFL